MQNPRMKRGFNSEPTRKSRVQILETPLESLFSSHSQPLPPTSFSNYSQRSSLTPSRIQSIRRSPYLTSELNTNSLKPNGIFYYIQFKIVFSIFDKPP